MSASSSAATSTPLPPSSPAPDPRFARLASEEQVQRTIAALQQNGIQAVVVSSREEAVRAVLDLIPPGASVLDATSQTLAGLGIPERLAGVPQSKSIRGELMRLHKDGRGDEARRLGSSPDVVVGSVHALTENGQAVVASATGSQLAPYAYGAGRVIWVVGTQKIVPDLATAFDRVDRYALPLESERALKAYGRGSAIAKLLVVNREFAPGRVHVVLLRENLGF
ncbi:MAG: lactate utilization protein [Thermoplasmata archaeon]|nr:lactate utilization protein [Thermoplasmata archaeon]